MPEIIDAGAIISPYSNSLIYFSIFQEMVDVR